MKKLLFIGLVALSSCKKETCNCGYIVKDNVTFDANGNSCYSLTVRNSCSQNEKEFCVDQSDWMNANVGENFCFTNVDSW